MNATLSCLCCGGEIKGARANKPRKWCTRKCRQRYQNGYPKSRNCLECGGEFKILTQRADANKKYCGERCSKRANSRLVKKWVGDHPDAMKRYNRTRIEKYPGEWLEKARAERLEKIRLLGGSCCVCGVTNPNWLHVDYAPTCRGTGTRHPRHLAYVKRHLGDFRLLCANHHYELTITGRIEGTDITQQKGHVE